MAVNVPMVLPTRIVPPVKRVAVKVNDREWLRTTADSTVIVGIIGNGTVALLAGSVVGLLPFLVFVIFVIVKVVR